MMGEPRSVGYEFTAVSGCAALFPNSWVRAGVASATNYQLHIGSCRIDTLTLSVITAAATNVLVRIYSNKALKANDTDTDLDGARYNAATLRTKDGLYAPGGNTLILRNDGAVAVVGDIDVLDAQSNDPGGSPTRSRWGGIAAGISAPHLVASFIVPVSAGQPAVFTDIHARCEEGAVVELVAVNNSLVPQTTTFSVTIGLCSYSNGRVRSNPPRSN